MSDEVERVHPEDRLAWRAWLAEHHLVRSGVWLVTWRQASGMPVLGYDEAVLEALAVGWVDSKGSRLDDRRTMLYFAPRRRGSSWSRPNKLRIERLRQEGLMRPAGEAAVRSAEADGSWTRLDEVEDLIVPPDLAAALAAFAGARANWDAFPRSPRRAILEWIVLAKRPETRAARIQATAEAASLNKRVREP
ncbi:YdeI/OmpD-associated family protein [Cryobacterium sp. SO2]|uniref:YdeI/OmpD-associated family protein n=1 Tax=Cryobacterium sp. SO2 TaxID=1897060 RepID=UPI00223CF26F|nr:YdeI/OmpD-associated family protein [Cryobacterium sp. SO2]WEO77575.1 YdeI/OmpD-associated family protein [Cryobacterium sp. SO2]